MLRITREEGAGARATLRLEGTITGEWSWLLERECNALLKTHQAVCLDLAGVSLVDRGAVTVLERLCRAGVEIWCRWDPVAGVLEGEGVRIRRRARSGGRPGDADEWI